MSEFASPENTESLEKKIERLRPIFELSKKTFETVENLKEAALTVTRRLPDGTIEIIPDLVVMGIDADGPNLAGIDPDGGPSFSATMLWTELIDAKKEL